MKLVTTQIISRFGFRMVLIVNGVLAAASLAGCALLTRQTPIFLTLALLFVGGLTRSMQFSALSSIGFADVPAAQMSSANSISSTGMQLNSGFGIALGALVLQISAALAGRHDVALIDFRIAFVTLGIIALIGTLDCFALAPDAGIEVSRRKPVATRT
jgi:MFS family permease